MMSIGNTYANSFVGNLALDCKLLTHMDCVFTGNADCDMYVRNGQSVKLLHNVFDGDLSDHCQFEGPALYVYEE